RLQRVDACLEVVDAALEVGDVTRVGVDRRLQAALMGLDGADPRAQVGLPRHGGGKNERDGGDRGQAICTATGHEGKTLTGWSAVSRNGGRLARVRPRY